jgi:Phage Mu protein F like protein
VPNINLQRLFDLGDKLFKQRYAQLEERILQAYALSLKEVQDKIGELYNKFENPTMVDVRKFNRLVKIEKDIAAKIRRMGVNIGNTTAEQIKNTLSETYTSTGFAIETGTGIDFGFTELPKTAMQYALEDNKWLNLLKQNNGKLLADIEYDFEQTLRANARQDIVAGLAQGKPYNEIAQSLKDKFDISATRAKMITRTEMHKNYTYARNEGIKTATDSATRLGLKMVKIWRHNPGAKTPRPDHIDMDGTEADENGIFTLPSGVKTEAPGLSGDPAEDINCACSVETAIRGITPDMQDKSLMNMSYDKYKSEL